MIKQFKYKNITWLDLSAPTADDIAEITQQFGIHPVAASELLQPSQRPKVDLYDNFIYLVLHFPSPDRLTKTENSNKEDFEIDFVIGKDFLITTAYEQLEPMQEFGKIFESNTIMSDKKEIHAGYLLFFILKHLYRSQETSLESINHSLKKAENKIFSGNEKEMVRVLANINKNLLDGRRTLKAHQQVLSSLESSGQEFFGPKFSYYLRAIIGEYNKVWYMLENSREFFSELKQTNDSLLQIKTSESTKIFTMLAFITFPLTLIATIFSIEANNTPFVSWRGGFWIIVLVMIALGSLMMGFYKYKKWL